jgi:hypothetical protein
MSIDRNYIFDFLIRGFGLQFVGHFLTVVLPTSQAFSCSILGSRFPTNEHFHPTEIYTGWRKRVDAGLLTCGRRFVADVTTAAPQLLDGKSRLDISIDLSYIGLNS